MAPARLDHRRGAARVQRHLRLGDPDLRARAPRVDHHRHRDRRRVEGRAPAQRVRGRLPRQDGRRTAARRRVAAVHGRLALGRAPALRLHRPPEPQGGVMASGGNRTEKATPKKRDEARKKGQVAKSMDLNGAVVLIAALFALSAFAPGMYTRMADASRQLLLWTAQPDMVGREGLGKVFSTVASAWLLAVLPVAAICLVTGVLVSVA